MRRVAIKTILLLFLFSFYNNSRLFAQTLNPLVFQKINHENGLSDNNVQCIFKSKNGFLWVGTSSGLNLLDGSDITVFKNIPDDSTSISNNFIKSITEDSSGILWIGTRDGLNSYDPFLQKFTFLPLKKDGNSEPGEINNVAVDQSNNLLIATMDGLFFYDRKRNKTSFKEIPGAGYEKMLNNTVNKVVIDKNGIVWLVNFNGLWRYDENTGKFTHEISKSNDPQFVGLFTDVLIGADGTLWIATWGKGLKAWNPVTKKIIDYGSNPNAPQIVRFLKEIKMPDGGYRICLNGLANEFDCSQSTFTHFTTAFNQEKDKTVNTVFSSNGSRLWVGSGDGLYYCNLRKSFIIHHRFNSPITHQGIALLQWGKKVLVSGEGKYFLRAYNEKLDETDDFSDHTADAYSCLSLENDGNDRVMAGTSGGIADIDLLRKKMHFVTLPNASKKSNSVNFITYVLRDSRGDWWLFPWRNGIWKMDSTLSDPHLVFKNFSTYYNLPKPLVISDAVEDKNSNIWMADLDEGIVLYNRKRNQFSKPFTKELGQKTMTAQVVCSHGTCYSFNGPKILEWNVDSQQLKKINLPPQIDKQISSIALDSIGNLWIASMNGLVSYNLKTKIFHLFTASDGLLSNEMDGTLYCCSDGTIIYASANYLSAFDPQKMLASTNKIPNIQLSEVVVNGSPYRFDTTSVPTFGHNINNFLFKWTVADFTNPLNNHYYYQLQGIDKDWRSVGNSGKVEFANLNFGSYTLLLKGENSNGISADKILRLRFQINPPFWKTWWFLSLLLCSVAAFFYFLYRYRLNQVLQIEKLRNKISLDLHDDIGSTLSSISILSDIALHQKKDPKTEGMLEEIKENSISLMDKMDDIVWSINPKNDSLESLFLRLKTFAAKLFEATGINYKIDIDENIRNIPIKMEFRQHIYLIMKEAINNLVKYSGATSAAINVAYEASLLTISIKDNGKGYDENQVVFGNGLHSMKKRTDAMGGELKMVSKINEGTLIRLKIKL